MSPTLRKACLDDAHGIAVVAVTAWQEAYRGLMPDELLAQQKSVEKREARFREVLTSLDESERRTWVCEDEGTIIGYCSTGPSRDDDVGEGVAEVYAVYFLPERWGAGLARPLQDHALADLRERGLREVTLWVLTTNDRARRFYEKAGFALDVESVVKELLGFELPHTRYRMQLRAE